MLHDIETVGGYVKGTVELPFIGGSASVLIDPEGYVTNEEIAFARRQLRLLTTLPEETQVWFVNIRQATILYGMIRDNDAFSINTQTKDLCRLSLFR